ncbi:MAG: hypothetical protein OEZ22_04125 [Spirochaetia bacterium]|nr:hypothetical protein [Spirochaetia bacterium]
MKIVVKNIILNLIVAILLFNCGSDKPEDEDKKDSFSIEAVTPLYYDNKATFKADPFYFFVLLTNDEKVLIAFNRELDPATAENINNYKIDGLEILDAKLFSLGGNLVSLTTSAQIPKQKYIVSVTGVKSISGEIVSPYPSIEPVFDGWYFKIINIDSSGKNIKISFQGEVECSILLNVENYSIDGLKPKSAEEYVIFTSNCDSTGNASAILLQMTEPLSAGIHTLSVNNVKDINENNLLANTVSFVSKPFSITEVRVSDNQVLSLEINDSVDLASAEKIENYKIFNEAGDTLNVQSTGVISIENPPYSYVSLSLASGNELIPGDLYNISISNLSNLDSDQTLNQTVYTYGNTFHLERASLKEQDKVEVCFSRAIDETAASNKSNFTIDGVVNIIDVAYTAGEDCLVLTTTGINMGQTYNVTVNDTIKSAGDGISMFKGFKNQIEILFNQQISENLIFIGSPFSNIEETGNIYATINNETYILDIGTLPDFNKIILNTQTLKPGSYSGTLNGFFSKSGDELSGKNFTFDIQ